jgi:hypothetical protein
LLPARELRYDEFGASLKEKIMANDDHENRDPITGEPGAHPVGTGIGAAVGGTAIGAAVVGALSAGPVGAALGATIGAIAGGLGGKALAEHYDPTLVDEQWRDLFASESYYQSGMTYEDYAPAYRLGAESRSQRIADSFEDAEDQLARKYEQVKGSSRLAWSDAKHAVRAAWNRDDQTYH